MSVFLLRMLEENGRLIAQYDPKMGIWANFWTGDGDCPTRKYKHVILLLKLTHDSEKNNQNQQKI